MNGGDVILIPRWRRIRLPAGIDYPAAHTVAVRASRVDDQWIYWQEDGMEKSVRISDAQEIPCCYIISQGDNHPTALRDLLWEPLAALHVEVVYVPMARISGLVNVVTATEEEAEELHVKVMDAVAKAKALIV